MGRRNTCLWFVVPLVAVLLASLLNLHVWVLLAVVVVAIARLLRELFTVDLRRLRLALAALAAYLLMASLYGFMYFLMKPSCFAPAFERTGAGFVDALYFSMVTVTTLGYGDFRPVLPESKLLVISQLVVGLLILAVGVNYIIGKMGKAGENG